VFCGHVTRNIDETAIAIRTYASVDTLLDAGFFFAGAARFLLRSICPPLRRYRQIFQSGGVLFQPVYLTLKLLFFAVTGKDLAMTLRAVKAVVILPPPLHKISRHGE
jgi:hypothetical protein